MNPNSPIPLSASRIKAAQECSWSYWARYRLKIPDPGNDGSKRGTICHLVLELLGNPRHRHLYDEAILKDSLFLCEPLGRLVGHHARRLGVNDQGETLYRLRGFIDKLFLYKDQRLAVIRDFKSSKSVFKGKDLTDNLQDLIYTLAVKKLFPHFKKRQVEFLFLKFDLNSTGNIRMEDISAEELEGLELHLTQISDFLTNFDEYDAVSNFASTQYPNNRGYPTDGSFGGVLKCGKDGYKIYRGEPLRDKDGNKVVAYICPYRKPLDYYVLKDKGGAIMQSFFEDSKGSATPNKEAGETLEAVKYAGCPYWYPQEQNSGDIL